MRGVEAEACFREGLTKSAAEGSWVSVDIEAAVGGGGGGGIGER